MTLPAPLLDTFEKSHAEYLARTGGKIDRLKQAVIAPLRVLGIATVEVRFDGYGDSGAVEDVACHDAENQIVDLPEAVTITTIADRDGSPCEMTLHTALEDLAYAALARHHPGWENNEGAGGKLEIDVAAESFMLDCKLRYITYDDCYDEL